MYITRVEIQNIRSIKHLVWKIDAANAPGWHVILGDNGSGKSTFVRSTSLGIIGKSQAEMLRQDWSQWITRNEKDSRIDLTFLVDQTYDFQGFDQKLVSNIFNPEADGYSSSWKTEILLWREVITVKGGHIVKLDGIVTSTSRDDDSDVLHFDTRFTGFGCAFGPFRRFSGGDSEEQQLLEGASRASRHLTVFSEKIALPEGLKWLQQQRFRSLEKDSEAKQLLAHITTFVNQKDFLPFGAQLTEVTSAGVKFRDGNGSEILVEEMSDGYRSVLSLTFELLRQLSIAYGPDIFETHDGGKVTVKVPGVVQIDEVDAHLHPTWQKRIGFWFREHFPQMQFIVTTHSPLVCQAAEKGSIFLLPRPGTDETGRMLEGEEKNRLLYGNILDAYSTEAFGSGKAARSDRSQELLSELSDLNRKEIKQGLTVAEQNRQEELRAMLPTESPLF